MDDETLKESLLNMKDTEGWQYVESYIHKRKADYENQLLSCPLEQVESIRESRRTLVLLLEHIEEIIGDNHV